MKHTCQRCDRNVYRGGLCRPHWMAHSAWLNRHHADVQKLLAWKQWAIAGVLALFVLAVADARDEKGETCCAKSAEPVAAGTTSALLPAREMTLLKSTTSSALTTTADGSSGTTTATGSSAWPAPSAPTPDAPEAEHAACYVYALDAPCVNVDGLDATFLTESVPIVKCESRGNPLAISPTNDFGLLQLNRRWQEARAARLGFDWMAMLEPGPNLIVAENKWSESESFGAWSCR